MGFRGTPHDATWKGPPAFFNLMDMQMFRVMLKHLPLFQELWEVEPVGEKYPLQFEGVDAAIALKPGYETLLSSGWLLSARRQ